MTLTRGELLFIAAYTGPDQKVSRLTGFTPAQREAALRAWRADPKGQQQPGLGETELGILSHLLGLPR